MRESKRALQVRMRVEVQVEAKETPAPVDPPAPEMEQQAPTQEELEQRVREAGRGGEGHQSHLQPDSWPRWLQRLGLPEGIPEVWKGKEAPKVLTGDHGPL